MTAPIPFTAPNAGLTMSSREIAELTGKEHKNVMRDIRAILTELHGKEGVLRFEHTLRNEQNGQEYPVFNLPKRETLILISGYSVALRARIIDRWQELESRLQTAMPDFSSPAAAARAWAEQYERTQQIEAERQALLPKAASFDQFISTDGLIGLRDAMRSINAAPQKGIDALKASGVLFYEGKSLTPKACYIDRGYFRVRQRVVDGESRKQTFVTTKGLKWLSRTLPNAVFQKGAA